MKYSFTYLYSRAKIRNILQFSKTPPSFFKHDGGAIGHISTILYNFNAQCYALPTLMPPQATH